MDIVYLLSQVIVFAAYVTLGVTYFVRTKKAVLIYMTVAGGLFLTHYVLLAAWTAVAVNGVCVLRNLWFYYNDRTNKNHEYISLFTCIALLLGFSLVTYATPWDLLSLVAGVATTWGVWQKNVQIYRYTMIFNSACWITYNIYLGSIFAIIGEIALLVSNIISLTIFGVNKIKTFKKQNQELELMILQAVEKLEAEKRQKKKKEKMLQKSKKTKQNK